MNLPKIEHHNTGTDSNDDCYMQLSVRVEDADQAVRILNELLYVLERLRKPVEPTQWVSVPEELPKDEEAVPLPLIKENPMVAKAREALVLLRKKFGYESTNDAYQVATGRSTGWPEGAEVHDYMAMVQLAALCGELLGKGLVVPRTHAAFLGSCDAMPDADFEPIFRNGEPVHEDTDGAT